MRVRLNSRFYSREAVEEALHDFKEVCKGRVLNGSMEVELVPKKGARLLKEEFCNYVLGLMKNKGLV